MDPRLTPARDDIAALHLKDKVSAARYAEGVPHQVISMIAGVFQSPAANAKLDTQAHYGEIFTVYDAVDERSWGQLGEDGYVGWINTAELSTSIYTPTHKVSSLRTIIFSEPDLKSVPLGMLSLNAKIQVDNQRGKYSSIANSGWVYTDHIVLPDQYVADFVAVAEMFLHAPYLWGGKGSLGLDCSGLVQSSMHAAGHINVLRDTDMQEKTIGDYLDISNGIQQLQRGDLIFWPEHVSIMQDETNMIHANAYHMRVASEPVEDAIVRIEAQTKTAVRSIKRPFQISI